MYVFVKGYVQRCYATMMVWLMIFVCCFCGCKGSYAQLQGYFLSGTIKCIVWRHIILYSSLRIVLYHIALHPISYCITGNYIVLYHFIPHRIVLYYIILYHVLSCRIESDFIRLYNIVLNCMTWYCIASYNIVLNQIVSHCTALNCIVSHCLLYCIISQRIV